MDKRAQPQRPEPMAHLLSSVGRSDPPHHSEVVRAELDEPLGHLWVLDSLPAPSLIRRDTDFFLKKRR